MKYGRLLIFSLVVWGLATSSLFAKREGSPLRAEIEVYSGGLMSDNVGAAFNSIGKGAYGARLGLGFSRFLNFDVNYAFSDQKSLLVADTGSGLAAVRTGNWHFGAVNASFNLVQRRRVTFYISPGVGFTRTGGRNISVVELAGADSVRLPTYTLPSFNLGMGFKIFPWKRIGFRIDARDILTPGGIGDLNPQDVLNIGGTPLNDPAQFFGQIPVRNQIQFNVGLIFRLL
ncbi:MAG: hypothetical protein V3R60_02700 [Acidobacteriota bacterium]